MATEQDLDAQEPQEEGNAYTRDAVRYSYSTSSPVAVQGISVACESVENAGWEVFQVIFFGHMVDKKNIRLAVPSPVPVYCIVARKQMKNGVRETMPTLEIRA